MDNDKLRAEFERQHAGRNLSRHHMRGTYSSPQIAALWNQHVRSVGFGAEDEQDAIAALINDDAAAISYQSLAQYRSALLQAIRNRKDK